jgi:hypothetical protein
MKPSLFLYCHTVFCLYALLLTVSPTHAKRADSVCGGTEAGISQVARHWNSLKRSQRL